MRLRLEYLLFYLNLWAILKQGEQTVSWENLEEKLYEIWNEVDAEVVRNMYKNYTNRLLEVKRAKGVMMRY